MASQHMVGAGVWVSCRRGAKRQSQPRLAEAGFTTMKRFLTAKHIYGGPFTLSPGNPMSAFLCSDYHLSVIARKVGKGSASQKEIFDMLRAQNIRSLAARYTEPWPVEPAEFVAAPAHLYSPLEVIHAIHCYEYQACETDDWRNTEASRWCRNAERTLLREIPEYANAEYHLSETRTADPRLPLPSTAPNKAETKAEPVALTIRDGV